jgi:hypothetical protein
LSDRNAVVFVVVGVVAPTKRSADRAPGVGPGGGLRMHATTPGNDSCFAVDDAACDEERDHDLPLGQRASHLRDDGVWLRGPRGAYLVQVDDDGWVVTKEGEDDARFFPGTQAGVALLSAEVVAADVAMPPELARRSCTTARMRKLLERLLRDRAMRAGLPIKAIFAARGARWGSPIVWTRAFREQRGLVDDLLSHRPFAFVLAHERELVGPGAANLRDALVVSDASGLLQLVHTGYRPTWDAASVGVVRRPRPAALGGPVSTKDAERAAAGQTTVDAKNDAFAARVKALVRWRDLLARGGRASRAHNLMIDRYGAVLEPGELATLSRVPLACPPRSRVHVALFFAVAAEGHHEIHAPLLELVQRASVADINTALRRHGGAPAAGAPPDDSVLVDDGAPPEHVVRACRASFQQLARLLVGRTVVRGLSLPAFIEHVLAQRAEERTALVCFNPTAGGNTWFGGIVDPIRGDFRAQLGDREAQLPPPPIPLPEDPRVRFLATVGDVLREADQMEHCVGSHLPRAACGRVWLFHVEHEGEHATVEVDDAGAITECNGPRNRGNGAVDVALELLEAWAEPLRQGQPRGRLWCVRPARPRRFDLEPLELEDPF